MTFPLTMLFMFLVFWRPQEWLIPWLYGWPLLNAIVYIAVLSLAAETSQGLTKFSKTPAIWLAIGLWVASIMSHVAHFYFKGMMDTIPETFKLCFFTLLLLAVIDRTGRARMVVILLVAAAVMMSVHALMQQKYGYGFGGQEPMWDFNRSTGELYRRSLFVGIFSDPNDLAQYLAAMIPLTFAVPRRMNLLWLAVCCGLSWLMYQAVLATGSRGGLVALSAAAGCMVFLVLPVKWLPYAGALALAGYLVLCAIGGSVLLDQSARERVVFWGYGNMAFKHNPIFGIGYGMFTELYEDRAAHNAFVTCYTELGLFGYWFWFNLLQLGMVGTWRTRMALRRPRTGEQAYLRRLAGVSVASLAGFAAGGYFLSRAFIFPFFFLFGLLNTIPLIAQRLLPEEHELLIKPRDVWVSGTIGTLFSVLYVYWTILILNKAYGGG